MFSPPSPFRMFGIGIGNEIVIGEDLSDSDRCGPD